MSNTPATATPTAATVKKFQEETKDAVIAKIEEQISSGDLMIPDNYAWKNAVQMGWLHLMEVKDRSDKLALEVCSKESIAIAFLDMIQQGLSVTKKQGYFVVYGNKLSFDPSYFGSITVAKRDCNVKEVNAGIVYEGDEFKYDVDVETGRKRVVKHDQDLMNVDIAKIKGAYAIVSFNDGTSNTEIMSYSQIKAAWAMGGSKGNSPAHQKFPDRMAAKTVINRALTILNASSDDSAMMNEDDQPSNLRNTIQSKANKQPISFDTKTEDVSHTEVKETPKPEQPKAVVPEVKESPVIKPSETFDKDPETDINGDLLFT